MDEIYKQLIQYGGGTAIIISLVFLLKQLGRFIGQVKNNNISRRLSKIENNDLHDLDYLRQRLDNMDKRVNSVEVRLARIETKLSVYQKDNPAS